MNSMPQLLFTSPKGGTIHSYPLTGGKTTFEKYLSCYIGICKFFNNIDEAKDHLIDLQLEEDMYRAEK